MVTFILEQSQIQDTNRSRAVRRIAFTCPCFPKFCFDIFFLNYWWGGGIVLAVIFRKCVFATFSRRCDAIYDPKLQKMVSFDNT